MSAGLYRLREKDCREQAESASDIAKKTEWLCLAKKWRRLATEVEMRQLELWGVCERSDHLNGSLPAQALALCRGTLRQH